MRICSEPASEVASLHLSKLASSKFRHPTAVLTCLTTFAEVGAGFSLAHAATASLLAVVTVLTILETESKP